MNLSQDVLVRNLGLQAYADVLQQMQTFTSARSADTVDEIWFLQHEQVFTQGQAGKTEHVLNPGGIQIVNSDRGGQVTYHAPGQLIVYLLCDLTRKRFGIKQIIAKMQLAVIELLTHYGISAQCKPEAPGVYVAAGKICSLGLRVRKGCTYHGLSLNVAMDLEPFTRINPCGYPGLKMVQMLDLNVNIGSVDVVATKLLPYLLSHLEYKQARKASE